MGRDLADQPDEGAPALGLVHVGASGRSLRYNGGSVSALPPIDLRLAPEDDRAPLLRMYAEHTSILHRFDESVVPHQVLQEDWWQRPGDLFPFQAYVEGAPVGFLLVLGKRYVEAVGETGDYLIWEMFVEAPHRGSGVAEQMLRGVLARLPGRWSVKTRPRNERALGFWRRVLLEAPLDGDESLSADGFATFRFVAR